MLRNIYKEHNNYSRPECSVRELYRVITYSYNIYPITYIPFIRVITFYRGKSFT